MEPIMNLKFQALFLLLLVTVSSSFASMPRKIPRLGLTLRSKNIGKNNYKKDGDFSSIGFKTFYFKQTIDHFNYKPESYTTFKHRYMVNTNSWTPGKLAPIFAYLGEEAPLDQDVSPLGFIPDNAPKFGALLVYIEHRYYGKSIPFGISQKKALKNATVRGYFNSAQALADYAEVLLHVKKQYKAENSPIIVFG
jgi:lysosomal Pro-X carboxypeptidase